MKETAKCYCGHTTYCDCSPLEQPKQETAKKGAKFQQKLQEVMEQAEAKKAKDKLDILYLELHRWKNIKHKIQSKKL